VFWFLSASGNSTTSICDCNNFFVASFFSSFVMFAELPEDDDSEDELEAEENEMSVALLPLPRSLRDVDPDAVVVIDVKVVVVVVVAIIVSFRLLLDLLFEENSLDAPRALVLEQQQRAAAADDDDDDEVVVEEKDICLLFFLWKKTEEDHKVTHVRLSESLMRPLRDGRERESDATISPQTGEKNQKSM